MNPSEDGLVQSLDHPIKLSVFEGPLDLLLFLIRKNELDIHDIPIEQVTRQYLDILYGMERLNLEVAGEFFVMAATLMHIKSRMLLPKKEALPDDGGHEEEEGVDPRWELVQQLLEYKRFKEAAGLIDSLAEETVNLLPRICKEAPDANPEPMLTSSDRIAVWTAFNGVLRRLSERMEVGTISDETVTVADRMEFLLEEVERRPEFTFTELFQGGGFSLYHIIATFLAVLELTRLKRIAITQDEEFGEIHCRRVDGTEESLTKEELSEEQ